MIHFSFPPLFVVKDGIHGLGVFVCEDIKKDTVLFQLKGPIIQNPTRTSIEIGKNKHIEDPIGAHINHNCTPNTKVQNKTQSFVSLRNIKKGEEITFDYNKNETTMASPFSCHCCGKEIKGRAKVVMSFSTLQILLNPPLAEGED